MKRKILSVLAVLMAVLMSTAAFSACSKAPAGAENSGGSGESLSESSESGAQTSTEGESRSESGAQTSTESENSSESGSQSENAVQPESTFLAEWCGFSVYLPEESLLAEYGEKITVKGDALRAGGGDDAAEFARMISVDPVEDSAAPFAAYDELYANADGVRDSVFGSKKCRSYDFQTEVQTEAFGKVYENKTIYCLISGDEIAVIEFSPLRGMGVSTQKEEFEEILRSISK
ncbi:MAG: hypothetical protein MR987_02165 [Oscillospiraceae bacterium]|nr:hypothetical protein [Oscillospiraceae bacterium]